MTYLILQNPGHNRVYYNLADKLALAEFEIAALQLSTPYDNIQIAVLGGVRYLSIDTEYVLSNMDMEILSRMSFVFAIFKLHEEQEQSFLVPVEKKAYEYLDNKISTLQKYHGKTNELFTRMMVNIALLSSDFSYTEKESLLDPVAGRGTTLYEGAVAGFNVSGIEIEPKSVHEITLFFKKYLQTERLKHEAGKRQVCGVNKSEAIHMHEFTYARSKEDFKYAETQLQFNLVGGNAKDADKYFKRDSFHLIVGDLPYGIVHGNTGGDKKSDTITRNPTELLSECIAGWNKILKKGGAVVIAWNSFLASRQKLAEIFISKGFEVLSYSPYNQLEHMVDKSIKRDVVVAKKN